MMRQSRKSENKKKSLFLTRTIVVGWVWRSSMDFLMPAQQYSREGKRWKIIERKILKKTSTRRKSTGNKTWKIVSENFSRLSLSQFVAFWELEAVEIKIDDTNCRLEHRMEENFTIKLMNKAAQPKNTEEFHVIKKMAHSYDASRANRHRHEGKLIFLMKNERWDLEKVSTPTLHTILRLLKLNCSETKPMRGNVKAHKNQRNHFVALKFVQNFSHTRPQLLTSLVWINFPLRQRFRLLIIAISPMQKFQHFSLVVCAALRERKP